MADCAEAKPATKAIAAIDKDFMMDDVRDVKGNVEIRGRRECVRCVKD